MKPIAFVTPWYGEKISGGAEAELRGLVHHLSDAGMDLEILTTCVESFQSDWSKNFHRPGTSTIEGLTIRRFPVRRRRLRVFDEINTKLRREEGISKEEEALFLREMVNSPKLYQFIRGNKDRYALFVFIPYMFGTTYYGVQSCLEKAVMIPCLHDEAYARIELFKETYSKVAGMIFNAEPERELAARLYGVEGEAFQTFGLGMDTDWTGKAERFREKYGMNGPFLLYAGRKEAGKKVDVLVHFFERYKREHPSDLKLVLLGGGEIEIGCDEILDLGFVPIEDKYDAYAAASAFVNPSQFESFSIVIMESWLAERPVLVNADCPVTTDFAQKANAGLYYCGYREFEACLDYLLSHKVQADQMGRNGRRFVLEHFAWGVIVERYREYFERMAERCE